MKFDGSSFGQVHRERKVTFLYVESGIYHIIGRTDAWARGICIQITRHGFRAGSYQKLNIDASLQQKYFKGSINNLTSLWIGEFQPAFYTLSDPAKNEVSYPIILSSQRTEPCILSDPK